jgi:dUTP pyrophosphatase
MTELRGCPTPGACSCPDTAGLLRAARADLERDRSIVAVGVERITKAIEGRMWLREAGRGSYAYNDDRYQLEFGGALDEIEVALAPLRKVARDWSNCSTDAAEIKAAREAALRVLKNKVERDIPIVDFTPDVARVLRHCEWTATPYGANCPWCRYHKDHGHKEGCEYAALLARTEQPTTALKEVADLHDVITHRNAWRGALEKCQAQNPTEDTSYWEHEIRAFDRTFDKLHHLVSYRVPTQTEPSVRFKRLPNAGDHPIPSYASEGAVGLDLTADIHAGGVILPDTRETVPTGFAIALPPGFEGQVRPRFGLAAKHGITVLNTPGTIDPDYRGEIKVILYNSGTEPFEINPGMRIAQLVVAPVARLPAQEVDELDETVRGSGGFGSTGI